jgi:uncharacterized membrane protein
MTLRVEALVAVEVTVAAVTRSSPLPVTAVGVFVSIRMAVNAG